MTSTRRPSRRSLLVGAVLAGQAGILIGITASVYRSGNLSLDFAIFNQAWYLMAHGHLDPQSTLYGTNYLHQHGEVIMLALAPLYWLDRNQGLTLLIIQDLAIVAATGLAAGWVSACARRRGLGPGATAGCVSLLLGLCLLHPWIYAVPYEDFHFEALAVLLVVAAGVDLWGGHRVRASVWVLLALLTGDVASSYAAFMGFGLALAVPAARRGGLVMGAVGVIWVGFLAGIGANTGSPVDGYAYLAGQTRTGGGPAALSSIIGGGLLHPGRAIHQLHVNARAVAHNLLPSGIVGVVDPLVILPVVAILATNALNDQPVFAGIPFQNLAVYILCPLGCAMLCIRLAARRGRFGPIGAAIVAVAAVVSAASFDLPKLASGAEIRSSMPATAGAQLSAARAVVPEGAEVIASYGIVGRLSSRRYVYAIINPGTTYPVRSDPVTFVIAPRLGVHQLDDRASAAIETYLSHVLNARVLYRGSLVRTYLWHPPAGTSLVHLP